MATKAMTIRQALRAFGVSPPCLHSWRRGTPTKQPLPVIVKEGSRNVLIGVTAARQWAKRHGVEFAVDPDVAMTSEQATLKSGPRASKEKPAAKKTSARRSANASA